jgi:hypothetical protein
VDTVVPFADLLHVPNLEPLGGVLPEAEHSGAGNDVGSAQIPYASDVLV